MQTKNKYGFTLIELLVVISVIGLIASVALVALNSARAKARDARRAGDLRQISNAFGLLYSDVGILPGDTASYYVVSNNNFDNSQGCSASFPDEALRPYLPTVCSLYGPLGLASSDVYYYVPTNSKHSFRLGARFETSGYQGIQFLAGDGSPVSGVYEVKR